MIKKIVFVILAAVLAAAAGGWLLLRNDGAITVKTVTVASGDITATLNATGKIISLQESQIGASVAGRVKTVNVKVGDRVEAGTVLARLDEREIKERVRRARAVVCEADEKVRKLKRDYESLAAVYEAGGTSRQSVADAKSNLEMATAAANQTSAELNESKLALDKLKVRAPFAGILTRKEVNPGEWAAPGKMLFVLADESSRQIEITIDESDAGHVKVGQAVELTSDAFPGLKWMEQVTQVAPAVHRQESANSISVRTTCGPHAPDLKLGQQVDAKIRTAHRSGIMKLPFECLTGTAEQTSVAEIKGGMVRFVPVMTGIEDATSVEIVRGVSVGETVIMPEGKPLKEGQRVKSAGQGLAGR